MRPYPLRDPGDDGQEPDCWLPGAGPAQQGLFLSLPAGSLDTDRFAQAGPAAEILLAAALQGVIFALIKAIFERAAAEGVREVTGDWPGEEGEPSGG
jgi:Protein of unknown function (DUF4235)